MHLQYLTANAAWVFVMGDAIVPFDGEPRFFDSRADAVKAAERKGMSVNHRGEVMVNA